jgi:tetratricopeptide (TPR) repeat protein
MIAKRRPKHLGIQVHKSQNGVGFAEDADLLACRHRGRVGFFAPPYWKIESCVKRGAPNPYEGRRTVTGLKDHNRRSMWQGHSTVDLPLGETVVADATAIKYRAFLSYSHSDMGWAKWLHRAIENFRIDKDLVGRDTSLGPVPKTLRPVFRDRDDFSGGHSLTDATIAALDSSAALIVLCSTVSATRPAVNEEVRLFRSRHPDRPMIPVIVGGQWPGNFPSALRYEFGPDGSITDRPITILGPDLRESGDGKSLGLAKIIAGLTGLAGDEIFRRAEREQRRKARWRNAIVGALALLTIAATGNAVYALHLIRTNEAIGDATLKAATDAVNEAVARAEKFRMPRAMTLTVLKYAERLIDSMAQYNQETPELRYRKAEILIAFAGNYAILGDTGGQYERAIGAHRLLAALAAEKPDNATYQHEDARSYKELGDVFVAQGNLPEALHFYRAMLAIMENLVRAEPENERRQHDLAVSHSMVADVLMQTGDLVGAVESYRASLAIMEKLARAEAGNLLWQHEPAAYHEEIGNVLLLQHRLDEALLSYRAGAAIIEKLVSADSENFGWQRDLSVFKYDIGDALAEQGNLADALARYRDGLRITDRLAKSDPTNAIWQRDLTGAYNRIGDTLRRQGDFAGALDSYRAMLGITKKLTQLDPNDLRLQRDRSVADDRVGAVLEAQKNLAGALQSYEASLAIMEKLAQADRSNLFWQRDLAVSYDNIGGVLSTKGDLAGALQSFRKGLAIRETLTQTDPTNAEWQIDLITSNWHLAILDDDAARRLAFIVATLRKFKDEGKLDATHERMLMDAEERLAQINPG